MYHLFLSLFWQKPLNLHEFLSLPLPSLSILTDPLSHPTLKRFSVVHNPSKHPNLIHIYSFFNLFFYLFLAFFRDKPMLWMLLWLPKVARGIELLGFITERMAFASAHSSNPNVTRLCQLSTGTFKRKWKWGVEDWQAGSPSKPGFLYGDLTPTCYFSKSLKLWTYKPNTQNMATKQWERLGMKKEWWADDCRM